MISKSIHFTSICSQVTRELIHIFIYLQIHPYSNSHLPVCIVSGSHTAPDNDGACADCYYAIVDSVDWLFVHCLQRNRLIVGEDSAPRGDYITIPLLKKKGPHTTLTIAHVYIIVALST